MASDSGVCIGYVVEVNVDGVVGITARVKRNVIIPAEIQVNPVLGRIVDGYIRDVGNTELLELGASSVLLFMFLFRQLPTVAIVISHSLQFYVTVLNSLIAISVTQN